MIHITVYTSTTQGEEILNLHVRSQGNPSLTDSITVRTLAGSGLEEQPCARAVEPGLRVAPNPVSAGGATISFSTRNAARCRLALHDVTGSLVETLLDRQVGPGRHEARWYAPQRLPAGVYLLRLTAGSTASTCPVVTE